MTSLKAMVAPKENSSGIIPIFKETFTVFPQLFETGRKSLSKSSKNKVTVAIDAPSGIPVEVIIESAPEDTELEEIKLVIVVRTP
jgi:hypothetical protein